MCSLKKIFSLCRLQLYFNRSTLRFIAAAKYKLCLHGAGPVLLFIIRAGEPAETDMMAHGRP